MPRLPIAFATSVLTALFLCLPSAASAAACDFTGTGSWHSSGNWSCAVVPDGDDSVTIGSGDAVTVGAAASAASLSMNGGTITLSGESTLAVAGAMSVNAGTLAGAGTVTVGGAFSKTSDGAFAVTNDGAAGPSPDLGLNGAGTFSGGSMCVADNGDGNPDLPNLYINSTFTIAVGAGMMKTPSVG